MILNSFSAAPWFGFHAVEDTAKKNVPPSEGWKCILHSCVFTMNDPIVKIWFLLLPTVCVHLPEEMEPHSFRVSFNRNTIPVTGGNDMPSYILEFLVVRKNSTDA